MTKKTAAIALALAGARNLHPDFADDLRVRIDLSVAWLFAIFGLARCQDGVLRAAPQQMIERDRAWSPGEDQSSSARHQGDEAVVKCARQAACRPPAN